ncbi:hypothetical protein [Rhodoplanes serenus]|uniref:hypothetical protein n=1 Tax=Rhodoplanes serenus TaxID=200615 RepID=UPI000DAD6EC0|nr:hypothetical protein [Rhodoplanes serenus]RAI31970.1 hypothetical protein CH340_16975 [Rhodoplanes serenus]
MSRIKIDHQVPAATQARLLLVVFGARAYGVARRMQRRNFRRPERARYWAEVARAIRKGRAGDSVRSTAITGHVWRAPAPAGAGDRAGL